MPVFDFKNTPVDKKEAICTYEVFKSSESVPTADKPLMVLDNSVKKWKHHSSGIFSNQYQRTAFEFDEEDGTLSSDILKVDSRFISLLKWLGENRIKVR